MEGGTRTGNACACVPELQRLLHAQHHLLALEGFGHEVRSPGLHRLDRGVDGAMRGQHHHRHVLPPRLQLAQEREAIHARHAKIGEHGHEGLSLEAREGLLGARHVLGLDARLPEQTREHLAQRSVVVDHQHARIAIGHGPSLPTDDPTVNDRASQMGL